MILDLQIYIHDPRFLLILDKTRTPGNTQKNRKCVNPLFKS